MIKSTARKIEAFLWHRGVHNEQIRTLLCFQIYFAGASLLLGGLLAPLSLWPLWFAAGAVVFANIFWGLARHMSHTRLAVYNGGLLVSVLLRAGVRLLLAAGLLYVVLIVCQAPPALVVAGVIAGSMVAFGTYAFTTRKV